jgi:hypothetical protein
MRGRALWRDLGTSRSPDARDPNHPCKPRQRVRTWLRLERKLGCYLTTVDSADWRANLRQTPEPGGRHDHDDDGA